MPNEFTTPMISVRNSFSLPEHLKPVCEGCEKTFKPQRLFHLPLKKNIPEVMSSYQLCFGVNIINDSRPITSFDDYCHILPLGVILIDKQHITVEELRKQICFQLPTVPVPFAFLTKNGYQILKEQEQSLTADLLITEKNSIFLHRYSEKLRVGIALVPSKEYLGFIFADLNWNVKRTRESVNDLIRDINYNERLEYRFLDQHGCPLSSKQELMMTMVDILVEQHISITFIRANQPGTSLPQPTRQYSALISTSQKSERISSQKSGCNIQNCLTLESGVQRKKTFKLGRISLKQKKDFRKVFVAKPILISYVRAEAVRYALNLKQELVDLGFSVFLDVHEIKTGSDWQDALNYAISNCSIFVPLITPMYGKTQWTNREVKLADALEKFIVPVNFLDIWPPECLAIQFATTQYISWKSVDVDHVKSEHENLPEILEGLYLQKVAREIAGFCKLFASEKEKFNKISKKSMKLPYKDLDFIEEEKRDSTKFIVISAHPRQRLLAHEMRIFFETQGLEVWCSTDVLEATDYDKKDARKSVSTSNTPQDLPTIPEKENVVSNEKNKGTASICCNDSDFVEKKPLVRMISQISNISQGSALTPEKIERLKAFRQQAHQAGVVVVVVSREYTKSKTSQQQVFYIEQRKRVVLVKSDDSSVPSWFRMLIRNDMISRKMINSEFLSILSMQVKRALNPDTLMTPKEEAEEAKIQYLVKSLKKISPDLENCVYIAGNDNLSSRAEEICRAIGGELAKVPKLTLVTGGFFGAPNVTAEAFNEIKEIYKNSFAGTDDASSVFHVLPMKDHQDFSSKSRQNLDGNFERVPYGKTVFIGDSIKERETVVARVFNICIVIGVVEALSAHEVSEFVWNDHFVIPVWLTEDFTSGVPLETYEVPPPHVSEEVWGVLSQPQATPEEIAKAVVKTVESLREASSAKDKIPKCKLRRRSTIRKNKSRVKKKNDYWDDKQTATSIYSSSLTLEDQAVGEQFITASTEKLAPEKIVRSRWKKSFPSLLYSKAFRAKIF
ncbi:uncharacterized protein LOC143236824 isoform X2 [Tachypleus tridentatus]|uniref:uncharacterized protein LOC143236824 isoform X2 n=1 Tax=Tachypleus tridentatus TaxID=6853 RepID=UPI003FD1802D